MVYCPIRGQNPTQRLEASLRRWSVDYREYADKIKVVPHDPAEAGLGFDRATRDTLLNTLTTIIHAAWPVNFQLPLASFRPHLLYLSNLIQLSLDVQLHRPACIFFCSSVGVALTTRGTRRIGEEPIMDCRQALSSGYTQSKLVAEYIMQRAAEDVGAWASNFRIGQIVGDTKLGLWNENEAPPLMIRSALTLGCLPALDLVRLTRPAKGGYRFLTDIQDCSWIPLDTLASAIVEIVTMSQQQPPRLVYNMCSPRTFSWKNDLLPKLAAAGLKFKTVGVDEWIAKLKDYGASHSLDIVAATCPAIKLLDFWEHEYGGLGQSTSSLEFDTKNSQADSWSLRSAPDVIESGLVELMVNAWMRNWNGSAVQKHVLN
jgi:thioester reductase-like protein